ncbi:MAG: TetR/AcrR family transcriptional regulator [Sneathiella sp.]
MQKEPTKRQKTNQRILTVAEESFKKCGYAGIGVDGIAKAAGVTSGAFYAHFGSKNGAFEAALAAGLEEVIETIPQYQKNHGNKWVAVFVDYYLGEAHREDLTGGCAMAALSPEIARSSEQLQMLYQEKMTKITDLVAQGLEGETLRFRRDRAWAMLGILIGGLNVSRAMGGKTAAEEVAKACAAAAIQAAGSVAG